MAWTPTIQDRSGPLYQRIVDALAADVAEGRLRRGQQLPTHRALAAALDVDISTITHAFREARTRGLIEARVGQGTFVAESMTQARAPELSWAAFDLSMNLPPQPLDADLEGRIARGIANLARDEGLSGYMNYREPGGSDVEREDVASWLRARIDGADATRVLICPGTQSALSIFLATMTAPGDTILTEALTYPGIKTAAALAKVALAGVAMDEFGILPDALERACSRHKPKALYLMPTLHNPTTATMPLARRKAVGEIMRLHGLRLFEDDAYSLLEPDAMPIAALVPELTYYAASVSKIIAPGLRVSFLLAPDIAATDAFSEALRASVQMTTPLMAALVARWLRDGSAKAIVEAIREEAGARQKLASEILSGAHYAARSHGHHLWLTLPGDWSPSEFVAFVRRQGLAVVSSDAFHVSGETPNAVRVALGAARSRHELGSALGLLASALRRKSHMSRIV
jgi:DNA-binding transcriptional MocR family regulator